MFRGLDTSEAGRADDPVVVKATDRVQLDGELTIYFREAPPDCVRDRQRAVLDVVETLESAGVLESVPVRRWPKRVCDPPEDATESALAAYEEFVDAVGRRALEPFFEEKAATGQAERIIVMPAICVALRTEGSVTGLYPHWDDGTHHSIEDCLNALVGGKAVTNVDA